MIRRVLPTLGLPPESLNRLSQLKSKCSNIDAGRTLFRSPEPRSLCLSCGTALVRRWAVQLGASRKHPGAPSGNLRREHERPTARTTELAAGRRGLRLSGPAQRARVRMGISATQSRVRKGRDKRWRRKGEAQIAAYRPEALAVLDLGTRGPEVVPVSLSSIRRCLRRMHPSGGRSVPAVGRLRRDRAAGAMVNQQTCRSPA